MKRASNVYYKMELTWLCKHPRSEVLFLEQTFPQSATKVSTQRERRTNSLEVNLSRNPSYNKKNAYALKTPHVVFLPVVFLSFFFGRLSEVNVMSKCTFFDLVTLTFDLDLRTWPRYPSTWPPCHNSSPHVCPFGWDSETDRHTHTDTHTRCQNYYTHPVRDVGCNKKALKVCEDIGCHCDCYPDVEFLAGIYGGHVLPRTILGIGGLARTIVRHKGPCNLFKVQAYEKKTTNFWPPRPLKHIFLTRRAIIRIRPLITDTQTIILDW